jgi:hypothetical protein
MALTRSEDLIGRRWEGLDPTKRDIMIVPNAFLMGGA